MLDPFAHQPLRRTWIGGYRAADVEVALAQFRLLVHQMENDLRTSRARVHEGEEELRELRRQVDDLRRHELQLTEALDAARRAGIDGEHEAQARAQQILAAAEARAGALHLETSAQTETMRAQVDELLRLRESLVATMRGVVREFEGAVGRIESGEAAAAATPARAAAQPAPPADDSLPPISPANGDVFDRRVELDAGPFLDFASLSAFERALGKLPKIEDVYIRRFAGDRATIDVTLEEPAPLLDVMAELLPYRLDVEGAESGRLAVTVTPGATA